MYALRPCRVLQHITIRKEEEELHTAIEAGLPDEDIGKLARISHRVRKCQLNCWWCFMRANSSRPTQDYGHSWAAGSILDWGVHVPSPPLPSKTRAPSIAGQHNQRDLGAHTQARKALTDIERKPHKGVRCYSSAQERDVLLKASQAAQSAISINATAAGIGSWVYKTFSY